MPADVRSADSLPMLLGMEIPLGFIVLFVVIGIAVLIMLRSQASGVSAEEVVSIPAGVDAAGTMAEWAARNGYRPADDSEGAVARYQKGTPGVTNPRFVELRTDAEGSRIVAYMQLGFAGKTRRMAYTVGAKHAPKVGLTELNDLLAGIGVPAR